MLQIPKKVDYGVQLLRYLSEVEHAVSLRKVSTELKIPFLFLQQIAQLLKKKEFLQSVRGAHGGYMLAKSLENITVYDILLALDEPFIAAACLDDTKKCHKNQQCSVQPFWQSLQNDMQKVFQSIYVLQ